MDLFDLASPVETLLVRKASAAYQPIGGTLELLPLCNMDCKMCFIRQTKAQMEAQGRMLTCEEWLSIAAQAKEAGVLFLLLTGGEPLLYPDFRRLYTALTEMGFIITINTNGTLINEGWADFFASRPCRRLNITLYGGNDAAYGELCRNPRGFTQVTRAAALLRERRVPFRFNYSITPDNRGQLEEIYAVARRFGVPVAAANYMFPPCRKGEGEATAYSRLTPEAAAEARLACYAAQNPGGSLRVPVENSLRLIGKHGDFSRLEGLNCRAGKSGFWINWKGELLPCGMFQKPCISLLEHTFREGWQYIVSEGKQLKRCKECETCDLQGICMVCGAACLTETGRTDGKPEYLCRMAQELYRLLLAIERGEDEQQTPDTSKDGMN